MSLIVSDGAVRPNSSGSWRDKLLDSNSSNSESPNLLHQQQHLPQQQQLRESTESPSSSSVSFPQPPSTMPPLDAGGHEDDEDGYESDWEREVTDTGEVFYVVPFTRREMTQRQEGNSRTDDGGDAAQNEAHKVLCASIIRTAIDANNVFHYLASW